ncbi:alpha/beta hydrolase [Bifidobacterium cuniculi]|uniref:Alpha/beta superfamily hydrolase n=1 Tax=Bifidobacterium cuniculi TaxID=1688 RepID=A0A087B4J1_9BIFI|nr:alpha/beta hydrolase [Bifidobacterium cuniculi]KFI65941.1 alpha/beta superfamily hydrolase [Bifidobacterium cuniculi]
MRHQAQAHGHDRRHPAGKAATALALGALGVASYTAAAGVALFSIALDSRSPLSTFAHKSDPRFTRFDDSWRHSDGAATSWFLQTRQAMRLRSYDGLMLHAWRLDPDTAHPLPHCYAIVMHGYTGSPEETAPWALHYARLGFTVVCPAQRAHELSEGRYVTMGALERRDLMQWVNRIVAHDPQARILLHGNSLGAATVLLAVGDRHIAPHIAAVVADSAYVDATRQLCRSLASALRIPQWSTGPMAWCADLLLRLRAGADLHDADVLAAVRRMTVPAFFTQGGADVIVDPRSARRLRQAYRGTDGECLVVDGAVHTAQVETDPHAYWQAIDRFLARHFPIAQQAKR